MVTKDNITLQYIKDKFGEPSFIDFKIEDSFVNQYIKNTNYVLISSNIDDVYNQMSEQDIIKTKMRIACLMVQNSDQEKATQYARMIKKELGE